MQRPTLPEKPTLPEPNSDPVEVIKTLFSLRDELFHWNLDGFFFDDEEFAEADKEKYQEKYQRISLETLLERVPKGVSPKDVFVTASVDEDDLVLEIQYKCKVTKYEVEMERYQKQLENWKVRERAYLGELAEYQKYLESELGKIKNYTQSTSV